MSAAYTGVFDFDYPLDGTGKVTQTDLTDPEGRVQRTTFNAAGFTRAQAAEADGELSSEARVVHA